MIGTGCAVESNRLRVWQGRSRLEQGLAQCDEEEWEAKVDEELVPIQGDAEVLV